MKIVEAIAYLNNEEIQIKDKFKVLTGYDSDTKTKDKSLLYWVNRKFSDMLVKLEQSKVAEKANSSSSLWGSFSTYASAAISAATGDTLGNQLYTLYQTATNKNGDQAIDAQIDAQEEYIKIVVNYLEENKKAPCLLNYEFTDSEEFTAQSKKTAVI